MSDTNKEELIAQFQSISGESAERSQFYLESAGWKVDLALSAFYEGGGEDSNMDTDAAAAGGQDAGGAPAAAPPGSTFNAAAGSDDSSDEDGQAFYAGGSSTSGQQILGPPKKKKDGADLVSEMFKKARESGAEQVDPGAGPSRAGAGRAFQGQAFKLGSDNTSSEMVQGAAKPPEPREFTLKMWSNGFSIDDGDLREYNDPTNRQFLDSVMKGRIPTELIREARGGEVHVNMEDHKSEDYVKPAATKKPFQGQGHMLGSITPEVTGAPAAATNAAPAASPSDNAAAEEKAKSHFAPDSAAPATTLQVRLEDGARLIVRMNNSRTVGDLREYIRMARPGLRDAPFVMRTSFPAKELEDGSATLEGAGLLNAAVMIRMK